MITRFQDAPFANVGCLDITVGGAGGIGGPLLLCLSRLQHNIEFYENDVVGEENLGTQLFKYSDVDRPKADVIGDLLEDYSNNVPTHLGTFEEDSFVNPYCFAAFDNMAARKMMYFQWKKLTDKKIFIDCRLIAESWQIIAITKEEQMEIYEKEYLFDDSEVEDLQCTYKATFHNSLIIGGMAVAIFTNYLTNQVWEDNIREVPLFTSFDIPTLKLRSKV